MTEQSKSPDLAMARLLADAVLQAYRKYENDKYVINIPGYAVKDSIWVYENEIAEFFGFTAVGTSSPYSQLVIFRGTDSDYEAIYDVSWTMTPCTLPPNPATFGNVSDGVLDFYARRYPFENSLRQSVKTAVNKLEGGRSVYVAGHSLGGAVSTLAALDILANRYVVPSALYHYTYGSIHVGDKAFMTAFNAAVSAKGASYRVVNLADFAPAMTGVSADTPGYVHVGTPWSYLWQTEGEWANHSLEFNYMVAVNKFPQVLKLGERVYPQ